MRKGQVIVWVMLGTILFALEACTSAPPPTSMQTPESAAVPYSTTTPSPTTTPSHAPVTTPAAIAQVTDTPTTNSIPEARGIVTKVIDGDTIEVDITGIRYRVRYIGIDTPELNDRRPEVYTLAQEATRYNRQLVEGKTVRLEKDVSETDMYGRLLRYVYTDDLFVNAELLLAGYAQVMTFPPDVKYQDRFLQAQEEARRGERGLWTVSKPASSVSSGEGASNIQITHVFYDGLVPRVESDEYVEITNLGIGSQDLAGWMLKDASEGYPSLIFPSFVLNPGKSVRVYTNEYHPEWGGFSFNSSRAVWNNSEPDLAVLYNERGQEVSRKSY